MADNVITLPIDHAAHSEALRAWLETITTTQPLTVADLMSWPLDAITAPGPLVVTPGSEASDALFRIAAICQAMIGPGAVRIEDGWRAIEALSFGLWELDDPDEEEGGNYDVPDSDFEGPYEDGPA